MQNVRWIITCVALFCAINCSATSEGPTIADNDNDDDSTPLADGCISKGGGACNCVLTCGSNKFGLDCDGATCTCTKNGSSVGSFQQAAPCTYSGNAYDVVVLGCVTDYPCK